jgi:hypothetical protein
LDAVRYRQAAANRSSELIFYEATHSLDLPEARHDRMEWIRTGTITDHSSRGPLN